MSPRKRSSMIGPGGTRHTPAELRLWRENRRDQEWTISDADLLERFRKWPGRPGMAPRAELIDWRGHEWALSIFVSDPSGLNSVWDRPDWEALMGRIWPLLRETR